MGTGLCRACPEQVSEASLVEWVQGGAKPRLHTTPLIDGDVAGNVSTKLVAEEFIHPG